LSSGRCARHLPRGAIVKERESRGADKWTDREQVNYAHRMLRSLAICALFFVVACSDDDCAEDQDNCCRVCVEGKACGDSCIQENLTCRVGDGCACNQCE
jgi:hypothetical protein